ncbi:cell division protein ZapA [uncultured Mitsuokella sp.]|uniref:cell division protein ZapA n=1 Tax=uncultured Mitsuokella sp. TaxID=453120 RepID=UPI00266FF9FC|nr:cell division protein ZapA [uncultured Mitsuokella sp.]
MAEANASGNTANTANTAAAKKTAQRVVVEIFGETYPLKTTDDPERLKKLAKGVDRLMKQMASGVRSFDSTKIAVLTALQIADEYDKLKSDYDELVELLDEK